MLTIAFLDPQRTVPQHIVDLFEWLACRRQGSYKIEREENPEWYNARASLINTIIAEAPVGLSADLVWCRAQVAEAAHALEVARHRALWLPLTPPESFDALAAWQQAQERARLAVATAEQVLQAAQIAERDSASRLLSVYTHAVAKYRNEALAQRATVRKAAEQALRDADRVLRELDSAESQLTHYVAKYKGEASNGTH